MDGLFPTPNTTWLLRKTNARFRVIFSEPHEVVAVDELMHWSWLGTAELFLKQFYQ